MTVGILALQGDFSLHEKRVRELGAKAVPVRTVEMLSAVDQLILPGGESTALLRLMKDGFRATLQELISKGLPTLATCAGLIIIAARVSNPEQETLGLLDIDVQRNAYGRQIDSFIAPDLQWTQQARKECGRCDVPTGESLEGVFIRAPRISRVGTPAVLAVHGQDPVLVQQDNIIGATFHPELSSTAQAVHKLLLKL